jgi:phage gp36-like protein
MNLASGVKCIQQLDIELEDERVQTEKQALTDAISLLGAYMILRLKQPLGEVLESCSWAILSSSPSATQPSPGPTSV